jgi:hypothetical protein
MTSRRLLSIAAGTAAVLGAGCGGDETTAHTAANQGASCLESFTSSAPEFLPRLARFSHAPGSPVIVGTYGGSQFSAETYDEGTEGDGTEMVVAQGACVITEVSADFGPLYIFVQADDGAWHRLLESDPAVPLVPDPERKLEGVEQVEIEQIAAPDIPVVE